MNQQQIHIDPIRLRKEVHFKMSCSSGNGGQNVNRVATKATLYFPIEDSDLLENAQKKKLRKKLKNRINKEDSIFIINQSSRSALKNKKAALEVLLNLLQEALKPKKVRKKMGIPKSVKRKRLASKKRNSEKKAMRKGVIY